MGTTNIDYSTAKLQDIKMKIESDFITHEIQGLIKSIYFLTAYSYEVYSLEGLEEMIQRVVVRWEHNTPDNVKGLFSWGRSGSHIWIHDVKRGERVMMVWVEDRKS